MFGGFAALRLGVKFLCRSRRSLEFFCGAGFYKDTAPTMLKGKAAPVARSGFGIIPANLFYCSTARKNRAILRTDPFTANLNPVEQPHAPIVVGSGELLGIREFVKRIQQLLSVCINISLVHGGEPHHTINGCLYFNPVIATQLMGNFDKLGLQSGSIISEHLNPNCGVVTRGNVCLEVASEAKKLSPAGCYGIFDCKLSGNSLGLQSPAISEKGRERPTNDGDNSTNNDGQPCTMIWVIHNFWWTPLLWLN
jgi:hypothetical protein